MPGGGSGCHGQAAPRARHTVTGAEGVGVDGLRAEPQPGARWLLVTSARHMPRAVASFRAAGWEVEAFPVDFEANPDGPSVYLDLGDRLSRFNGGLKEWLGLVGYRILGWTDEIFPAPR